jgi:sialate O-acetylesterase
MRIRLIFIFLLSLVAQSETTVPAIFGDHMVLQRGAQTPVWGTAPPGQSVSVEFAGQKVMATADARGRWRTALTGLAANPVGAEFIVSGDTVVVLSDVVVGDVWLASGQSNMAMTVAKS